MKTIAGCLTFFLAVAGVTPAARLQAAVDDEEPKEPAYDAKVLATFYGFGTLTNGDYTATLNGGTIKFARDTTWDGNADGLSVLVRYSDHVQPTADAFLVTLKSSVVNGGVENGVGVFAQATDGTVHGVFTNATWTGQDGNSGKVQVCDKTMPKEGYMILTYKGASGTILYDGEGKILYKSSALMSSTSGQQIGDLVTVGSAAATMTVKGVRIFKGVLAQDEVAAAIADYEKDEPPPVAGAACVYDWTFTNKTETTGSNNIAAAAGVQNKTGMTGDSNAHYTNAVEDVYTALRAYVRPYANVQVGGGQSIAYYGTAAAKANTILFALGQKASSMFLATNPNGEGVVLARTAGGDETVAASTLETLAGVDDPNGKPHLYVLELSADKTSVKVWVDGTLAATHVFGSAISLSAGVQISGMYKGKPTNWSREENEAECTSAVSVLRIYDHALSAREQAAIVAEFKSSWLEPTVVPAKDFAYEPKAGAKPTGWLMDFDGEKFDVDGQFRIGPDGNCISVVTSTTGSGRPYAGLGSKSNYTMALYADLSQVAQDKTGRYLLALGGKSSGINQGVLMTSEGKVQLFQANKTTILSTAVKTEAMPAAGYHLIVWTQSTTDGATLYVDGNKIGTDSSMTSATAKGIQIGSLYQGVWNDNYAQAYGMAVAGAYGWDRVLTDAQVAALAEEYPFVAAGCEATAVDAKITGTLTLVDGDTLAGGTYGCAIAVAAGATVDLLYDGEIKDGAQILSAKSVSADGAAFTVNGAPLPEGFEIGCTNGKIAIAKVRVCELTGLHIAEICGKPKAKDPNGRESGWVELVNYGPEAVNLRNYKLYRLNYGKKDKSADAQKMLDREVKAGERTLVYMSEDYPTAEDYGGDGVTIKNYGLVDGKIVEDAPNAIMVIPTKVNPKKYPSVILYDDAGAVIDKVVVPCEIDDDGSVLVGITTNKLERFVTFAPTPLQAKSFATAIPIGPEVNGLYGKKDYANDLASLNCHTGFAAANVGFTVRMPINPACESKLAADKIKSVRLVYRVFDPAGSVEKSVDMTSSKVTDAEKEIWGKSGVWEGTVPAEDMVAGKLVQYAAMITDGSGAEWRAPRFVYPELGYEWYGVVVDPGEAVKTDKLQTFLMFIDNANKAYMDKDASEQEKYLPHCARTAIYDTQTHTYYDNVRIDLRGNTSKGFTKKSHGLRFNKVAPLVCTDPTTGEELEVRKTSFVAEFADPTYMRQMLSFWMLRDAGCLAPFDYPVRVYLNGAYYQLAFHSERFSDDLIENVYKLNQHVYSYKNIGTFGGGTSAGGIEKKTPDDDNEKDLALLNAYCARFSVATNGASLTKAQKAALDATVVTNFDIAAWINYIAATRISSECDDVWANLSGYIDKYDAFYNAKGDNMLHPLAYDMNLSWGQHYRDGGMGQTGLKADKDWFKSHPFYGGFVIRAHPTEGGSAVGNANYAYETILQNATYREMLVRRTRTLMDKYLGAPGTTKEDTPLWQRMRYYRDLIADDAAVDRAKWPIDSTASVINNWPTFPADLDAGLEDLWTNYIEPRRVHLYDTHSVTNTAKAFGYGADLNAGIPLAQAATTSLKDSIAIANLGSDELFHDEEVLVITNKSNAAVDISGWQLKYSVACTLPGGTVIPAFGCVYVPANRRTYVDSLVAEGAVSDQIVTASADFNVNGAIALVADDGTEIVKRVPPTNESAYLRLHSFCGNTADGLDGDTGEWFVLTNVSDTADLDLAGVTVCFLKDDKKSTEADDHCHITFAKGTIKAGQSLRCEQADYAGKGWVKIQNNKLKIKLCDFYGSVGQSLAAVQKDFDGGAAYGKGGWLVADSHASEVASDEWHVETAVVPVKPGEASEMKAKTQEEAEKEIAKYKVELTQEDKDAGVSEDALKMEAVPVTNAVGEITGFRAVVAVNPAVVPVPSVGGASGVEPIVVTPDADGTAVSVGIVNATVGLWYGYEVCETLGGGFANDVPSFARATGPTITVTGSKRDGASAFFRVKVLPAQPTK